MVGASCRSQLLLCHLIQPSGQVEAQAQNRPVYKSSLEDDEPTMPAFRDALRQHTSVPHQRLEALAEMQAYATGEASVIQYRDTVNKLYMFWSTNPPATQFLPPRYHAFRNAYLRALEGDCGDRYSVGATASPATEIRRNELALFYVLIGSSLGAKQMLKWQQSIVLPRRHLLVLAELGSSLWREFLDQYLFNVLPGQEAEVLQDSQQIFEMLLHQIGSTG